MPRELKAREEVAVLVLLAAFLMVMLALWVSSADGACIPPSV